jgi:hypothetical protein
VTAERECRYGDYEMLVHSQGCSDRSPCCIVAAFVPEPAYKVAINRVTMLSYSLVHTRRMGRCAWPSGFIRYTQPDTLRHRGRHVSAHPVTNGYITTSLPRMRQVLANVLLDCLQKSAAHVIKSAVRMQNM